MKHPIYSTVEFQRQVDAVIYDMEADLERERRREYEASYMFRRKEERLKCIRAGRAILGYFAFVVGFGGLLFAAWCFSPMLERFMEGL